MMRISLLKTVLRALFFAVALAAYTLSFGQQDLTFDIQTSIPDGPGDIIEAEFRVYDFTNILSMQFTLEWDESEMEFVSIQDIDLYGLSPSMINVQNSSNGILTLSWLDPDVTGISKPPCATLFSMRFTSINGNSSPVTIISDPTVDEIIDGNSNPVTWTQSSFVCNSLGSIQGNVFRDLNNDCLLTNGETGLKNWKLKFEDGIHTYYRSTNQNGDYTLSLLPGDYDVSLLLPNEDLWETCITTQTITVDSASSELLRFPVQALIDCPLMSVDLSAPLLRRCFSSNYYVQYCNEGTTTGEDAYIVIEFDTLLEVVGSSHPWSSVDGNTYTFDVGDVPPSDCHTFSVEVEIDCDAMLGQTHCTSAHIYPDAPCVPTQLWDGSDLDITGTCDGDSVRFEIINLGEDMNGPVEFIVIEDDMIYLTSDPVQLLSQQSVNLSFQANGSTWRVEMPETPNNPFGTFTTDAVEGCGTNGNGSFSLGFLNQFPLDDESPAADEDCQENIGSYDPNDKTGYPRGFCQAHYIRAGQDIEYKIRFQNTGTDTAFNIVVIDTLSNFLSPASVRPGASSHPYEFELLGEGVVKFSFPNIMLPDSNINEPGSHGFVKFSVSQQPNIAMGSAIENYAAIYFDFNEPVFTNIYRHTIGDDFVEMQGQTGDLSVSGTVRTWFGEPVEDVEMTMTNLCPVYTDSDGYYLFENIDTAVYSLYGTKATLNQNDGITVLDMLKIRQYILFIQPFESPYQQLAASFNQGGGITTFDLVIYSKVVLGIPIGDQFLQWKFFRSDYDPSSFGFPFDPTSFSYTYNPLATDLDGQDFVAVQPGNILDEAMVEKVNTNTQFYFEPLAQENGQIKVNVKANGFTNVNAFQFGLKWDPNLLQYDSSEAALLTSFTPDWQYVPTPGEINMAFIQDGETTASPNEVLFTLVFNVLGNVGETTTLELDESNLPLQVVVDDCKLSSPSVLPTDITIQEPNAVIDFGDIGLQVKVAPNPVQQGQPIQLEVTSLNARSLDVQLYGLSGTLVEMMTLESPAGKSLHTMGRSLQKGVYFLKVTSGEGMAITAKLMVY